MKAQRKASSAVISLVLAIAALVTAAPAFAAGSSDDTGKVSTTRPYSDPNFEIRPQDGIISTRPYSDPNIQISVDDPETVTNPVARSAPATTDRGASALQLTLLALVAAMVGALASEMVRRVRRLRPAATA